MAPELKTLMKKGSIWQRAAADLGRTAYSYGSNFFGALNCTINSDCEKLNFYYLVDKEENYFLLVCFEHSNVRNLVYGIRSVWNTRYLNGLVSIKTVFILSC